MTGRGMSALRALVLAGPTVAVLVTSAWVGSAGELPLGSGAAGAETGVPFSAGSVSATGGLQVAAPINLPPARGGLPIPFAVQYTGDAIVHEAGVGWRVPFS
ncbi:MAG: hypothetical protein D6689_07700 [Deltaproteobacteria bacterium]|nr:MAG: hypothetical protein D6689_07700 [Deltaproteobacteria bacterium]